MGDTLIEKTLNRFFPDWVIPVDTGKRWEPCLCPFHGDTRPSAAVSFSMNAFSCLACGVKGGAVSLIKQHEGVSFAAATRIAEEMDQGSNRKVHQKPTNQSRRIVLSDTRSDVPQHQTLSRPVSDRVRGRSCPWA